VGYCRDPPRQHSVSAGAKPGDLSNGRAGGGEGINTARVVGGGGDWLGVGTLMHDSSD
jgi:hypothetical protein